MEKDKKIILFADDNKAIRKSLKILTSHNILFSDYDIEYFVKGSSLKRRLERNIKNVCAVVTDEEMPEINGSEIIKEYAKNLNLKKYLLYYVMVEKNLLEKKL